MLRVLNEHPDIFVLHNILDRSKEVKLQYDIFKEIKRKKPNKIQLSAENKKELGIGNQKILAVKNGVFEVRKEHFGFGLIRNPFSVFISYQKATKDKDWRTQMLRWAKLIDKKMLTFLKSANLIDAFCSMYVRKIGRIASSDQPRIYYENLVNNPENELKKLMLELDISWDDGLLNSHNKYPKNSIGHGGIKLNTPIYSVGSLSFNEINQSDKEHIYAWTSDLLYRLGYSVNLESNSITLNV